jgi:hypothetical protein
MPRKTDDQEEKEGRPIARRGRRAIDPGAKRSYRYVMRMHPDLADALGVLANEAGLSRALFVERVLISFANQDPRMKLNHIGRRVEVPPPPGGGTVGSLASFGRQWQRFQGLRQEVLGEELYADPYRGASIDDYGRDPQGRPVTTGPRPPMPDHLRPQDRKKKSPTSKRGPNRK